MLSNKYFFNKLSVNTLPPNCSGSGHEDMDPPVNVEHEEYAELLLGQGGHGAGSVQHGGE